MPQRPRSRPRTPRPGPPAAAVVTTATATVERPEPTRPAFWTGRRAVLAAVALLTLQAMLAVRSLVRENPTVDEVIHMPAGVTYWQTGSFRLYHHNPPLVKLVAALPVLAASPAMGRAYQSRSWQQDPPNKMVFAHEFMEANARRYFELFTQARLVMPLFAVVGGVVVFAWSRALYGNLGGLVSLALWTFCPNVLAHARLVTTDMGAAALGLLATYLFWRELKAPSWSRATLAGLALGLAQLSKFSLLILYGIWPALAALQLVLDRESRGHVRVLPRHAALVVALSVLVIDLGYGFEGVGIPLGRYEFACGSLTRPVPPGVRRPASPDPLLNGAYQYRINRFRGTLLDRLPAPLPKHYLLGFDDQKLEAEGIPNKFLSDRPLGPKGDELQGYPVYLDGTLQQTSWWYYYLLALVYKVPEGTWALVVASFVVLALSPRSRASWFDEWTVLAVPAFVLFVMSVFTNINLGVRYVLPAFPFVYVSAGKLAPWAAGLSGALARRAAWAFVGLGLLASASATLWVHPHYLAYFNALSGGPSRGAEHLIDSNLDWGQDLVNLRDWLAEHAPGERVGIAYFGQINPEVFAARGETFDWFQPPPRPETMNPLPRRYALLPTIPAIEPGLYAVSKTLVKGLPWRVYDRPAFGSTTWLPRTAWFHAFSYFGELTPVAEIGHSILVYRVTPEDAARLAPVWEGQTPQPGS